MLADSYLQAVSLQEPDHGDLDAGGRGGGDPPGDAQGPRWLPELLNSLAPDEVGVGLVDGEHAQQQLPDLHSVDTGQGEPGIEVLYLSL